MKGRTWEGGLRVPLIARMPGVIPPGTANDQMADSIDMLPILCHLAGVEPPADRVIDGKNIMPLVLNVNAKSPREAVFGMHGEFLATIRSGKWKLHVRNPGPPMMSHLLERRES